MASANSATTAVWKCMVETRLIIETDRVGDDNGTRLTRKQWGRCAQTSVGMVGVVDRFADENKKSGRLVRDGKGEVS